MATTIKTVMTYPLDGSTTDFNIPFEYLARKFVRVTLIGVDRKELILNQDYRFATKTTISTTRALGPADGYTLIEIRRYTSATERLVDFTDGSILRAYDLNISQVQTLHVAEEARDLTADTIGVNNDGDLDARGRRIVNVADAKDPGDAITLGQVQRWNDSALNSKNAAKVSETNAKTSETNAKTSENAAHKWAQNPEDAAVVGSEYSAYHYSRKASKSSTASEASAVRSDSSAAKALTSETNAKTSETNAKTSETNAKTSETNAKASADKAEVEAAKLGNMNEFAASLKEVVAPVGSTRGKVEFKPEYTLAVKKATAYEAFAAPLFAGLDDTTGNLSFTTDAIVFTQGASKRLRINVDTTYVNTMYTGFISQSCTGASPQVREASLSNPASPIGAVNIIYDRFSLSGRGGVAGESSAFGDTGIREVVGTDYQYFIHLSGFGTDNWWSFNDNGEFSFSGGFIMARDGNIKSSRWGNVWLTDYMDARFVNDVWLGGQEWVSTNQGARIDYALGGGSVCTGYTQDATGGLRAAWLDGMFHRKLWIRYGNGSARVIGSA